MVEIISNFDGGDITMCKLEEQALLAKLNQAWTEEFSQLESVRLREEAYLLQVAENTDSSNP